MNTLPTAIDFSLSTQVSIGQIPALQDVEKLLTSHIYVVHYPEGVSGELMTLRSGELEGMKTASIMSEDGIVASAGFRKIDVGPAIAQTLLNLRHFGVVAAQVNQILGRIGNIESFLYQKSKAELDNIFIGLRDLSRRMPEFLADASYKSYGLTQLAQIKKGAGDYFQLQLGAFDSYVQGLCNEVRRYGGNQLISQLDYLRNQSVFKALELVAIVELFEIVIDGRYTDNMLSAARHHLKDRSDQIMAHVDRFCQSVNSEFKWRQGDERQQPMTYYEHKDREKNQVESFLRINEFHERTRTATLPLDDLLDSELDRASVKKLLVSAEQGLLMIKEGKRLGSLPDGFGNSY